jgi:hypothetical protein
MFDAMGRTEAASAITFLVLLAPAGAQPSRAVAPTGADEPVVVTTDHPRLFLRPARLRLLQRERERTSTRWQQFDGYLSGQASLPEPGFAEALYYQVSGDKAAGRRAIAWALRPAADLRQMAFVYDWCQKLLSIEEQRTLTANMTKLLGAARDGDDISSIRSRVLAAVALFDNVPTGPQQELEWVVRDWWAKKMTPRLSSGGTIAREDAYAFWELLHALRDSTNIDLRESCPDFFKQFPIEHLMSYYPQPFRGEDNDFFAGASAKIGAPNIGQATFSRAAELAMVGFDTNAEESQYLQGWLMHDRFMLRAPLGAPYEFLWANPYQPGLSFTLLPLVYHDSGTGRLFVRSSWEENADWFGYFDRVAQLFHDGRPAQLDLSAKEGPIRLASAMIYLGRQGMKFRVSLTEDQEAVIVAGLEPRRTYQIEIDDEELFEESADAGGILVLDVPQGREVGVRLK